jgi:hypothetical protein
MTDRHWGWPSRARVPAQSFEEPLTHGGVSPGLLKPMLSLGLMRSLEALADHAEDPRPVLAFHVGTLANFGCQLGCGPLGTTIESY